MLSALCAHVHVPYARADRIEALDAETLVADVESLTDDDVTSSEATPQFLDERHALACLLLAHGVPQSASPGAFRPVGPVDQGLTARRLSSARASRTCP